MWIESHSNLARHPKTRRLMKLLGWSLPDTIGNLHLLWWWALDFAPTGDLSQFSAEDLTADLDLCGATPEQFVEAMVAAGFLDRIGETLCIHDWTDYNRPKPIRRSAGSSRPANAEQSQNLAVPPRPEPEQPVSPRALRDDLMVEHEPQGAVRVDCVENTALQGAASGHERNQNALRAVRREFPSATAESDDLQAVCRITETDSDIPAGEVITSDSASSDLAPHDRVAIPHLLAAQPGFTNVWPKFLEMYKDMGCPLTSYERRELFKRLHEKPRSAVSMLEASVKIYQSNHPSSRDLVPSHPALVGTGDNTS